MPGLPSELRVFEGSLDASGLRFGIAVSRFNSFITERLLEGAVDVLTRSGAAASDIDVFRTPGAWELPLVTSHALARGGYDAFLALGCLIRGSTIHFDLIAAEASKGLGQLGLQTGVPVVLGLLTTDSIEQAVERAGTKHGNKGAEAASAAIEQARLVRAIGDSAEAEGQPRKRSGRRKK
ncbi:MAG: 6,7-dimethyl-8-ribityllumazine synthase [Myxococcales bacterium FL481]|nr:MAG: 6,7-dimethyl-8-ribityllumazine synthase [Myxococcales bacterium FL481]